jgi:hypothetical protein
MSSRACRQTAFVGDHESPNPVGQAAFQTAHGLVVGFAGCDLRVVVGPTGALVHAYLGERDDVQRKVELAITTRGKRCRAWSPLATSIGAPRRSWRTRKRCGICRHDEFVRATAPR